MYKEVEEWGWKPWANTVAYFPLDSTYTVNDYSSTYTLTNYWATFGTYSWVDCLNLSNDYLRWNIWDISQYSHTISVRANRSWWSWDNFMLQRWIWDWNHKWWSELLQWRSTWYMNYAYWFDDLSSVSTYANNTRHNIVVQYDKSTNSQIMYIDWNFVSSRVCDNTHSLYSTIGFIIGTEQTSTTTVSNSYFNWWVSSLIIENKLWTATEASDYFNKTKWNYWL